MRTSLALVSLLAVAVVPTAAHAFCGFYVAGSGEQLVNDATQVVLMRNGTRTVLAMQNHYKGPPDAFALVVPVPVVLKDTDVKTLSKDVFARVEQMSAPRLVEYWEQDPCAPDIGDTKTRTASMPTTGAGPTKDSPVDLGVTVEAEFTVGEYQIVILSAKDSTGLDTWLRQENYNIPAGAEPLLRPYVETGMKFFVAKVDPTKVVFQADRAVLSPLRFHYDADDFALPIRLGLANSSGTQDLIVNILAPNQRYEVANYKNVTIPTNIDVKPRIKDSFPAFYAALFDATLEQHEGAVVTEYAWQATTCDPCPGPTLGGEDFMTLGADVLLGTRDKPQRYDGTDFVLTRLHARYGKDLKDDLVFKQAGAIQGGREVRQAGGGLEQGASTATVNNFQARYAIRYPWTGPIRCSAPRRGRWGGPPAEVRAQPDFAGSEIKPALDLANAPRGTVQLAASVAGDIPEIGVKAGAVHEPPPAELPVVPAKDDKPEKKKTGCGCEATDDHSLLWLGVPAVAGLVLRRRRRR